MHTHMFENPLLLGFVFIFYPVVMLYCVVIQEQVKSTGESFDMELNCFMHTLKQQCPKLPSSPERYCKAFTLLNCHSIQRASYDERERRKGGGGGGGGEEGRGEREVVCVLFKCAYVWFWFCKGATCVTVSVCL